MKPLIPLAMAGALAACSGPAPDTNSTGSMTSVGAVENGVVPRDETMPQNADTAVAPTEAAYLGRWVGVEGMYLTVTKRPKGGVSLAMQWDLDHRGVFDGAITAKGLQFVRNGITETLIATDGNATGLKWLAGKPDCLTVKSGEGYCRDR